MKWFCSLRSAFAFLTRLPVGPWRLQDDLHGIAMWLPVIGLVVGGLVGLALWGLQQVFTPLICAVLGCAVWVLITGGLHLDGVADCGDALPVEVSKERRLEIMKDSRLGTFGGIALFFNLVVKVAALASLLTFFADYFIVACALAALLARVQIFLAMKFPSARPGGMGAAFAEGTRPWHAIVAYVITLACCAYVGILGAFAFLAASLFALVFLSYAKRRLGGVTGDVFGCLIELTENVVLLVFCFVNV